MTTLNPGNGKPCFRLLSRRSLNIDLLTHSDPLAILDSGHIGERDFLSNAVRFVLPQTTLMLALNLSRCCGSHSCTSSFCTSAPVPNALNDCLSFATRTLLTSDASSSHDPQPLADPESKPFADSDRKRLRFGGLDFFSGHMYSRFCSEIQCTKQTSKATVFVAKRVLTFFKRVFLE